MKYVCGPQLIHEPNWLAVDESTEWHAHKRAHNTFLLSGEALVELEPDGESAVQFHVRESDVIRWVEVPAGVRHRVTLKTPNARVVCVFSHFDPDTGEPADKYTYRADAAGDYA